MKAICSGAIAIATLVLIDSALFNAKYTSAGRVVLDRTASAILR
jgi:hypothetical protein